ncbi:unnamed protein product [Cercospora beticola]|nr:unnamed protein product [Cercospora beticola]
MAQCQPVASVIAASGDGAAVATFPSPSSLPILRFQPAAEPRPLNGEVEELIRPWRRSEHKPPFTTGELVVIAHILSDLEPQRLKATQYTILSTFAYYRRRALLAFTDMLDVVASDSYDPDFEERPQLDNLLPGLYEAARDFEHPLTCVDDFDPSDDTDICEKKFTICAKAARIYLRERLELPRQGSFDFMGLPAELREKIYKMLLVYPKPGLTLADHARERGRKEVRLGVWSRTDLQIPVYSKNLKVPENEFAVESPTKTLALLRVSKQIRHEALPVFYGRNTFNFGSLNNLECALDFWSHEIVGSIQELRIVVDWNITAHGGAPVPETGKLCALGGPKKLTLTVPHNSVIWTRFHGLRDENRAARFSVLSKLARITDLNEIIALAKRAKHVELRGDEFWGNYIRRKIGQSTKTQ